MGAIVTSIAKQQSALKVTEFRPVASICTKFIILLSIIYKRTSSFMERHELLEDAQEAFRKCRSTQRQLFKLQSFLENQRNAKHPVVLQSSPRHRSPVRTLQSYIRHDSCWV
jgi:hypothetical protein